TYFHECRHRVVRASLSVFQAGDGIRDRNVTGVQTCALPISSAAPTGCRPLGTQERTQWAFQAATTTPERTTGNPSPTPARSAPRSEERRVGKKRRRRGAP